MNWSSIPTQHVADGISRQLVTGERMMVCRFRFAPNVVTPIHSHPHEQITMIESGRARFSVDGAERIVSSGDVLHFPPNCLHGATMLDEPVVLVDIFSPIREDFLK